MNDASPPHHLFRHYSELPYSLRVLFTATLLILGMGYLFALLNIFFTYAGRAGGNPMMLSYEDIVVAYSGSGHGSILEGALSGPMAGMLPPDERATVLTWVRQGASRPDYEANIRPILDKRCMACHDGSNPHLPNLSNYDGLQEGRRPGHRRDHRDAGSGLAHPPVRLDLHLLHRRDDVQPRLCAPRLVQVRHHRDAVPGDRARRQLLVFHQALPSLRLGW